jgi:transposase-like protein
LAFFKRYDHRQAKKLYQKTPSSEIAQYCSHKRFNTRIVNSKRATREKEMQMRRFISPGSTQKFLTSMESFINLLKAGWYKHLALDYRQKLKNALLAFDEIISSYPHYA